MGNYIFHVDRGCCLTSISSGLRLTMTMENTRWLCQVPDERAAKPLIPTASQGLGNTSLSLIVRCHPVYVTTNVTDLKELHSGLKPNSHARFLSRTKS
jgi:hypothetical protein